MDMREAVKKAIHYGTIQSILQYYICPEECEAHCCKNGQIHIFEEEYRNFSQIDPEKAKKIQSEMPASPLYRIETPCSFLKPHDRCGVYYERPIVCGLYPFKVNTSGNSIGLQPCPVGFLIIKEFALWMIANVSKTGISEEEKAKVIAEWENTIESYDEELSGFHMKNTLKEIQIPFDELEMFAMYMSSKEFPRINSGVDLG